MKTYIQRERIPWKILEFDSDCLGLLVGDIVDEVCHEDLEEILQDCRDNQVNLAVWKTKKQIVHSEDRSLHTVGLHARSVLFSKAVSGREEDLDRVDVCRLNRTQANSFRAELMSLAFVSGEYSRFKTDPALTRGQFRSLYTSWIDNIIASANHDYIFVAVDSKNSQKLDGFISLSIAGSYATIGLFAVAPCRQRTGIGSALMKHAEAVAATLQCTALRVTTQKENLAAMSFYEKFGYSVEAEHNVYHFWLLTTHAIRQNVPYLTGLEIQSLTQMLKKKCIESAGESTYTCQKWIRDLMNVPAVLLTGSATSALEQAAILCNLGPGDEVIMPSYTFVSTANAVCLRRAVPVFVDVNLDCQIDVQEVEKAITDRTKAVIAVHYGGQCCQMDALVDLCRRRGLYLIEDAAQAFLSTYKGKFLGTFGHFGCFSFHYTKNTICGEGGALLINDGDYVHRAHIVWEKGTNRVDFIHGRVDQYEWKDVGSSFVPNELSATFLEAQLHDSWYCSHRRRCIVSLYQLFLKPLQQHNSIIHMKVELENVGCNGHLFWLLLHEGDVVRYTQFMESHGIICYSHYKPLHASSCGSKCSKTASKSMRNTELIGKGLIRLPVWVDMTHIDVYRVISWTLRYFRHPEVTMTHVTDEFNRRMASYD